MRSFNVFYVHFFLKIFSFARDHVKENDALDNSIKFFCKLRKLRVWVKKIENDLQRASNGMDVGGAYFREW